MRSIEARRRNRGQGAASIETLNRCGGAMGRGGEGISHCEIHKKRVGRKRATGAAAFIIFFFACCRSFQRHKTKGRKEWLVEYNFFSDPETRYNEESECSVFN